MNPLKTALLAGGLLVGTHALAFQEVLTLKKPHAQMQCGDGGDDTGPLLFPAYLRFNNAAEIEVSSDPNFMSVDTFTLSASTHRLGPRKLAFVANHSAPTPPFLLTLEGTALLDEQGAITKANGAFITRYTFSTNDIRAPNIQTSTVITCFGSGHFAAR